jgi:hypothetical protein
MGKTAMPNSRPAVKPENTVPSKISKDSCPVPRPNNAPESARFQPFCVSPDIPKTYNLARISFPTLKWVVLSADVMYTYSIWLLP